MKRFYLMGAVSIGLAASAGAQPQLQPQQASELLQRRGIIQAATIGAKAASRDELSVMLERLDQANRKAEQNFASRQEAMELRKQIELLRSQSATLNETTGKLEGQTEKLDQR